ncbi:hypothetical protein Pla175_43650 [Pirellulimonas nuda]|uniref:Planctomycete cytochrome C n=1 Tax=Pirellulimonas nuda TaxID=2528009 RepID=A0A518DHK2_9BACT|nr:DUF1549 and DUF1553 domain-containing protein [Pirellulimonas nuda]QDU90951.1 hypothetical protein Pla175_43650 [Pirellulimonas nuda]
MPMLRSAAVFVLLPAALLRGADDAKHWAFEPLRDPAPPITSGDAWSRTEVDRFLRARQLAAGLTPNPEADRRTLIRRATYDLHGLPPTPKEVEAFVSDPATDAYDRLIDRLLASPRYGERWGRHWLDLARYGDSMGYRYDDDTPGAYHYRDFVIRALNADMPYDRFVGWQIAGDELAPGDPDALAATGLAAVGPKERIEGTKTNRLITRYDELDDIVSTVGSGMLGLTVGCARCHDHKNDPVTQAEYYGLVGVFLSGARGERELTDRDAAKQLATWRTRSAELDHALAEWVEMSGPEAARLVAEQRRLIEQESLALLEQIRPKGPAGKSLTEARLRQIMINRGDKLLSKQAQRRYLEIDALLGGGRALLVSLAGPLRDAAPVAMRERLDGLLAEHRGVIAAQPPAPPKALVYVDQSAQPTPSPLMARGSIENPEAPVPTNAFLHALTGTQFVSLQRPAEAKTTHQRAALAHWMTDVDAGGGALLARVMANRLWHYHFGEGLVRTPSDFGIAGDTPAAPELLDWLAGELVRRHWSLKAMHRLIMQSAVYRQTGQQSPEAARSDPENRLWSRKPAVRLESEALRDAMLLIVGKLNDEMYGPPVRLPIPKVMQLSMVAKPYPSTATESLQLYRRTVYAFVKRTVPNPLTQTFDGADPSASCGCRIQTTVAPQALLLMNNEFVRDCGARLAERVVNEVGADPTAQLDRAYELALNRPPTVDERAECLAFLEQQAGLREGKQQAALADMCQLLFALNEFHYID